MRKAKWLSILSASLALTVGAVSLTACDGEFTPLASIPTGEVSSNGGFVVEKGDYVYFINGVDAYTSDNTYGNVVKGALVRAKKSDVDAGTGKTETVVPSLMVASDYTSGLYIYGDRVYYATPNNVKNTDGVIESEYLDFKSAKLDGSDVVSYFNVADNTTVYRYVESGEKVYLVYAQGSELHSYNTVTEEDALLAKDVEKYVMNKNDKSDDTIYYTMKVKDDIDTATPNEYKYTQVYKVSASTTKAPYEYKFDEEFVEENEGELPYVNLGTLVLDGIGGNNLADATQFSQDVKEGVVASSPTGFTYDLQSYQNGGLYFTRTDLTDSAGSGWLYYLPADLGENWNTITGNVSEKLDVIAQNTDKASASALFYKDGDTHHYLYVDESIIKKATVIDDQTGASEELAIAKNVSGATLSFIDDRDETYDYVYFTRANGSGLAVERAVFNGTEENYTFVADDEYRPVKILDVQHNNAWYPFEIIADTLYYADAESYGATSFNYINAVNLKKADGKRMNNAEIKAFNERYEAVTDYINDMATDNAKRSTAIKYVFYTGELAQFEENIKFATDNGKKADFLYTEEDMEAVRAYKEGKEGDSDLSFKEDRFRSAFVTQLGQMSEVDQETLATHWETTLEHFTVAEEEDGGLPAWAWVLIGIGIAIVVATAVLVPILVVKGKKRKAQSEAPKKPKMAVDTTDDRTIDVYADPLDEIAPLDEVEEAPVEAEEEAPAEAEEAPVEEAQDAPAGVETPSEEE